MIGHLLVLLVFLGMSLAFKSRKIRERTTVGGGVVKVLMLHFFQERKQISRQDDFKQTVQVTCAFLQCARLHPP